MKLSDATFESALFAEQAGDPATPASGFGRIYIKSGGLYFIGDNGTVIGPLAAGGTTTIRVEEEGVSTVATASALNFVGASATVTDAGSGEATITITSSSAAAVAARARRGSTTSVVNATWTAVPLDTETFDTDAIHDTGSNTSRMTIPTGLGGKWQVNFEAGFAANGNGSRYVAIAVNGTRILHKQVEEPTAGASNWFMGIADIVSVSAGDYIEGFVYQDSGGAVDLVAGTYLSVARLGS